MSSVSVSQYQSYNSPFHGDTGGYNKYDNSNNSTTTNLYSPYGAINRGQTPLPPQSLSPGLSVSGWLGPAQAIKGGGGGGQVGPPVPADAKRPKSYQCEACDKWFTSSGHLKRHFNTTLHKNAMKQKGDGSYEGLNGASFSIPSVESRDAASPCMSLGEESSQSSVCDDVQSNSGSGPVSMAGSTPVSTPGPAASINPTSNLPPTSLQDNCSHLQPATYLTP